MDVSCLHFITGILDCACILIAFEPKTGKRMIQVKEHRTKMDYAYFMKDFVQDYPEAESIELVPLVIG